MSARIEDYKMTTPEYIANAIVIRVNPMQVRGSVRLVCADEEAEQSLLRLKQTFGPNDALAQRCIDQVLAKTFPDDLLCTSSPDMTPVVLIKDTSVGNKTMEEILTAAHTHCVMNALDRGLDVPGQVMRHLQDLHSHRAAQA